MTRGFLLRLGTRPPLVFFFTIHKSFFIRKQRIACTRFVLTLTKNDVTPPPHTHTHRPLPRLSHPARSSRSWPDTDSKAGRAAQQCTTFRLRSSQTEFRHRQRASYRAQQKGLLSGSADWPPLGLDRGASSRARKRGPPPRLETGPPLKLHTESLLWDSAKRASSRARHRGPPLGLLIEGLL